MDRRAVLRALGVGIGGLSGCARTRFTGPETTTGESSNRNRATTTRDGEVTSSDDETTASDVGTTGRDDDATTRDANTTAETTETLSDGCPRSVVSADRRYARDDYGLGIVAEDADRPAVAVVGEDWRSELRTGEMSEADEAFVTGTDFEQFVLLVVQYPKSSGGHELRVTDYETDGDRLRADVCVVARGATQDAPTENLFVRVPYSGSPPSRAKVRIRRPNETITVSSQ